MLGPIVAAYAEKHMVRGWEDKHIDILVQENLQKCLQETEKKPNKTKLKKMF